MELTEGIENNQDSVESDITEDFQNEIEKTKRELVEIDLMLEQSQMEVNRLAQRNAAVTARLQQIQGHYDSIPRDDIIDIFNQALDAQQRLFVMRGQSEKLQGDKQFFKRHLDYLNRADVSLVSKMEKGAEKGSERVLNLVEAIIQAQEEERQRLSRKMHDGPAQALSNFILQTEIAVRLFDIDQERAREELSILKSSATSAFQQVRDFIFELRPMMLDDLGLVPTLKRYVETYKEQTGTSIRLTINGVERRFEPYIEVIIFRAVQEILSFSIRQERATQISVQMNITDTYVKVTMDDNGKGEDVESILESGGMGIKIIKDRVEMIGGFLEINFRPDKGSQFVLQVPVGLKTPAIVK